MLRDVIEPPQVVHGVIVSRIKIMARLDIAEKRQPQDGRIALRLAGRSVDVRVSILPTAHGERVVLRLLDKQAGRLDLTGLGMADTTLAACATWSSSRTALSSSPDRRDRGRRRRFTPRSASSTPSAPTSSPSRTRSNTTSTASPDPGEPRIELTFARALRAILRQDRTW